MAGLVMDAKSQLEILEAMTPQERSLHFQEQKLQMEQDWLDFMVRDMKEADEQVAFFTRKAKQAYSDYDLYDDESRLMVAEQYVELATTTKEQRYKLNEVREQRERVQCQLKIVNEMKKMQSENNTENQQS